MNNHRRVMRIPSPRYFLDLTYLTKENSNFQFENAYYNYTTNEWEYKDSWVHELIPESKLPNWITEDEERRVALDYERGEYLKNSHYKMIGIF